jgi:putative acetyltransferase
MDNNINKLKNNSSNEIDAILKIWLAASIQAHNFIPQKFWEDKLPDMKNIYLPNAETWILEEDNSIKGFFSIYENKLAAIFVDPKFQGKGYGTQLLNKAKSLHKSIELTVYSENIKTIKFYITNGFKIVKEQFDPHTKHKELVMKFN